MIYRYFHVTEQSPNEVVVAYKNPTSIEILDIRNTRSSPISGTKSPILLSYQFLSLPKNAYILSTIPYFTEVIILVFNLLFRKK